MERKNKSIRRKRIIGTVAVSLCALSGLLAGSLFARPVGCSNDDLTAPLEAMTEGSDSGETEEKIVYLTLDRKSVV